MNPKERACLASSETEVDQLDVHLYAFKNYTETNCLLECQAALMLRTCGCLMYYYPWLPKSFIRQFIPTYNSSKDIICDSNQLKCLGEHAGNIIRMHDMISLKEFLQHSLTQCPLEMEKLTMTI